MMRKSVFATATIILCLGFGIGATGTFFTWMESVILQPVPGVGDLAQFVSLKTTTANGEMDDSPLTLDAYSSVPYLPVRLAALVLSVLGAAALVLATVGLYAVTAYAVTQRRREIGIRIALGATPARIVAHFLAHAARYAGTGALAGVALASAALGAVAVLAVLIAANRAARMSPMAALREE